MKSLIIFGLLMPGQFAMALMCGNYNIENPGPVTLVAPAVPVYANCERRNTDPETGQVIVTIDQECVSDNQQKLQAYNYQSNCYSQASQVQQNINQAADADAQRQKDQAARQAAQEASAKAAAEAAQKQSEKSSQIYQMASIAAGIVGAAYLAKTASCSGPQAPPCIAALVAIANTFFQMSNKASGQSASNAGVAVNACNAASQMSSEGGGCGPAPAPYNPQTFPSTVVAGAGSLFDAQGNCIGNPADCATVTSNLPTGVSIQQGLGKLNSMAGAGVKPFNIDANGNLISKDGKKYDENSLKDEKSMIAAGMSPADAKALAASMNKLNSGIDAKLALAKENKSSTDGSFGDGAGGASAGGKGNGLGLNGNASANKDIGGGKRGLASAEGLAKDFNGDMIGVAGDDIFKMMNRRYKLKTAQDNFIAP